MSVILVIEDELFLRQNIKTILEIKGYICHEASHGAEGIELLNSIIPDLILCDVMMPGIDGFGVLEFVKSSESLKDIPFIFLTARADSQDREKAFAMKATDYITKPFSIAELIGSIEKGIKKPIV
ncbi:MAG: response regulator [Chitinophagia bacterium]